jgi:hypothetical protein
VVAGFLISNPGNADTRIFLHVVGSFRVNHGFVSLVIPVNDFKSSGIYFFHIFSPCSDRMAAVRQKIPDRIRPPALAQ